MGTIWLIFLVGFLFALLVLIFFEENKKGNRRKKFHRPSQGQTTTRSTPVSVGTNPPPASHAHTQNQSFWSGWLKTIFTIFFIVLTILLLIWGISYIYTLIFVNNPPKTELVSPKRAEPEPLRISEDEQWKVVSPPDRIRFTGEYGEIYRGTIPGSNYSIENLTEPCCLINNAGEEYCSDGINDFKKGVIPKSKHNAELRFKSQNGEVGYLNIYFWVPN